MPAYEDALEAGRDYVWKSYDLHFKQRNEFLRTYSAVAIAIYAAIGFVLKEHQYLFGLFVGGFAVFSTYFFYRLDLRVRSLMADYELFLEFDENAMSEALATKNLDLAAAVKLVGKTREWRKQRGNRFWTYGAMIEGFYLANTALAVVFMAICIQGLCAGY